MYVSLFYNTVNDIHMGVAGQNIYSFYISLVNIYILSISRMPICYVSICCALSCDIVIRKPHVKRDQFTSKSE